MSELIEDRLREAYQAKAAQLTEQRLDQLSAARENGLDDLLGSEHTAEVPVIELAGTPARRRQHRWIAPTLAAAAVAAVAVGVTSLVASHPNSQPRPNPPATHFSSSPPSTSAPAPSPSATQTHTQPVTAPPYLPAGQTGSRSQVPWSIVGAGWRLLQREQLTGRTPAYDTKLYLYDPAGGRYLITDRLPDNARLVGWSPDGNRAMFVSAAQPRSSFYQLQLASGSPQLILRTKPANFLGYTQPRGLAFLIEQLDQPNAWRLYRYSAGGGLEFSYPVVIGGQQVSTGEAIYSADGSQLILTTPAGVPFLVGNDGHFIRTFAAPAGYDGCTPVKLWQAGSMLEHCTRVGASQSHEALVIQPLSGAAPRVLADAPARNTDGYWDAWPLSNGDLLLDNWGDCDGSTYDIMNAGTGAIRPLRWPAGIPRPSTIIGMSGDIATFEHRTPSGCGQGVSQDTLYSYNMLTGQTRTLLDGYAVIVSWPGDQG